MSDDQSLVQRGRDLLRQAFERCEIPEGSGDEYPPRFGGGDNIYYRNVGNEIEIVFSYYHMAAGSVYCSISLGHLATQTAQGFGEDEEAIEALVDALKYLESSVSVLLPTTHHKLLRRVFNLKARPRTDKEEQKAWIALLEQLTPAFSDRRSAMERKLAAERDWRGGSQARLNEPERSSLHIQYDELHRVARDVKKDYNQTKKRFEKSRKGRGYPRREWKLYWRKYLSEKYPPELIENFLGVFAREDDPSAADIAYIKLAKQTRHKQSYLPRLVAESRKASKSNDNQS